jgi:hypothetical protein
MPAATGEGCRDAPDTGHAANDDDCSSGIGGGEVGNRTAGAAALPETDCLMCCRVARASIKDGLVMDARSG